MQHIKTFLLAIGLALGAQSALGFALHGPGIGGGVAGDNWEIPAIGYGLPGDIGTPKNIGEEYRRNTPVMFYAYDANFLATYFGSNGVVAVDSAMSILNNLTNVDSYSANLTEFPLNSQHFNFKAQALGLTDLKSVTLQLMAEQLGLAEPDRYVWTLHDRLVPAGGRCPFDVLYTVVQRNFDIVPSGLNQVQYSSYINGILYTYEISEICSGAVPLAVTVPFAADPSADTFTAIASFGLDVGGFNTSMTRDDIGGLRYLLRTNNINFEDPPVDSVLIVTNIGGATTVTTLNLHTLLSLSRTNDPATLATLFPGLVVASSTNDLIEICSPNIVTVLVNSSGEPAGTPPHLETFTNGTTCVPTTVFTTTFANVFTNANFTNTPSVIVRASTMPKGKFKLNYSKTTAMKKVMVVVSPQSGAPAGSPLVTNVSTKNITLDEPSGEFVLLPPGQCGWEIITNFSPHVVTVTNGLTVVTNSTGSMAQIFTIEKFTNHTFKAKPIFCDEVAPSPGLYQGIKNIKFIRADFDALIGQTFQPVTNDYFMTFITPQSQLQSQHFRRVVTQPDIVFSAQDQVDGPGNNTIGATIASRNVNFDQNNILSGLAGPGTITTPTQITFDKGVPAFLNGSLNTFGLSTNQFLSELNQTLLLAWGSFDGTTNDPIVYPNGTSLENLENQIVVQISPSSLANGVLGVPYPAVTFTATGGAFTQPFTWSASGNVPPGLSLSSDGTLSGTPTQSGTYDFTLQLTDTLSRSVQWVYTITID